MSRPESPEDSKAAADIVDLYDRRAADWVADRGRDLTEADRRWLDRLTAGLQPGDAVLDVGCGSGRPMAAALIERGFRVTGVDSSANLIAHAAADLPEGRFVQADMRTLDLGQTFAGVLAWHSLFHLSPADQRLALPRLLAHAAPRASVMFSSGPREEFVVGSWRGDPLYHGSLGPEDYQTLLTSRGFAAETGLWADNGSVWLAHRMD
ncbi:class I SAM-dependent methyltransferase [Brevundimonas sp. NIBR11]|uniref:class I SAM-dependent methyltransferase n=1 Tax=Brevundimonas sp. NIBR11 TaxID=3015999 RepID=UPI0022F13F00|nr:class I SAM-dependent methyltransferase [Brevundimonas sp. NIBR11]WGM32507.1 Trans-aconitate 2-methyltransferase [Brevundimonas sp. NIBR11]